ncbi:nuclear transcription factor Y subunit C-2-like [Zingiber officinale]|uniref:Core Histone H2A/H2B/H3 domain-containing protein n=1 Tax=Zingiber officinale TaxID=94328 RepID=A0A8J5KR47_ZINOF|nr:nuclear transcription factor Y subunit C-2-like [Zingiber officinale]KAG6485810.1 hypothetical protein ZIOFF_054375 [Zingiber officinale]
MISAEAQIPFAKACELFVLQLTIRSWLHAEKNKRCTLQKKDFLVDIVPQESGRPRRRNSSQGRRRAHPQGALLLRSTAAGAHGTTGGHVRVSPAGVADIGGLRRRAEFRCAGICLAAAATTRIS